MIKIKKLKIILRKKTSKPIEENKKKTSKLTEENENKNKASKLIEENKNKIASKPIEENKNKPTKPSEENKNKPIEENKNKVSEENKNKITKPIEENRNRTKIEKSKLTVEKSPKSNSSEDVFAGIDDLAVGDPQVVRKSSFLYLDLAKFDNEDEDFSELVLHPQSKWHGHNYFSNKTSEIKQVQKQAEDWKLEDVSNMQKIVALFGVLDAKQKQIKHAAKRKGIPDGDVKKLDTQLQGVKQYLKDTTSTNFNKKRISITGENFIDEEPDTPLAYATMKRNRLSSKVTSSQSFNNYYYSSSELEKISKTSDLYTRDLKKVLVKKTPIKEISVAGWIEKEFERVDMQNKNVMKDNVKNSIMIIGAISNLAIGLYDLMTLLEYYHPNFYQHYHDIRRLIIEWKISMDLLETQMTVTIPKSKKFNTPLSPHKKNIT